MATFLDVESNLAKRTLSVMFLGMIIYS